MSHKAFPIAGYTEGLFLARQPFMSPTNAYRQLVNGRVSRGRLEKRAGYSFFGYTGLLPETVDVPVSVSGNRVVFSKYPVNDGTSGIGDPPPSPNMNGQYQTIIEGTVLFELGALQATLDPSDRFKVISTVGGVEIGDYVAGFRFFQIWWDLHPNYVAEDISLSTMTYSAPALLPITGISKLETDTNVYLFAFDTQSVCLWSDAEKWFEPQEEGPGDHIIFSGESDDLVWTWPISTVDDYYLVFTNGVDPVYRWMEGASPVVSPMPVNLNPQTIPGNVDAINTALLVLSFRGRLIYLGPTEDGTKREGRARWTIAGSFTVFDDDGLGWADAPAVYGAIQTAGFIGDRLYVGFEHGWMELRRTSNPTAPFEWIKVTSRFGARAKLTTIQDSERLLTRSSTSMQSIDPNGQYEIDAAIPDLVADWAPDKAGLASAARNEEAREFWWSFVNSGASEINAALVGQYESNGHIAWAEYDTDFRVFGEYEQQETINWDDLPGTWNDYTNVRWDDQDVSSGFPIFLGGKLNGIIYRIGTVSSDDTRSVDFVAQTQAISPYPGIRAHLGWIDVYAESAIGASVDFTFYDNVGAQGYKTITVDFSPSEPGAKVYRRVRVGRSAEFHQIKIHTKSKDFFAIDAIIPWFRPAGRVEAFG